jgi:hypothetical protein
MFKGEYIQEVSVKEQEQMIVKYLNDFVEILSTFNLIVSSFPESILEIMRGTNALIFLANSYCLTIHLKKDISSILGIRLPKLEKDQQFSKREAGMIGYILAQEIQTLKKLCVQSTINIL